MRRDVVTFLISWGVFGVVCVAFASFLSEHRQVVPEDKGLSPEVVKRLYARGERAVHSGKDLETIGMPVGGIAAGQIYLRGDGTLAQWWIFNKHEFTGYGADCYRTYRPESPVDSGFAVVVDTGEKVIARKLDKDFGQVEFSGEYPIGVVTYRSEGFPVEVQMEAFSPFIPLNAQDSALPGTLFGFSVKNVSDGRIRAAVVGWLENAVCFHSAKAVHANRRSRIVAAGGRTMVVHTAEDAPPPEGAVKPRPKIVLADFEGDDYGDWRAVGEAFGKAPARGTLPNQQKVSGFLGQGLVNTYLGGDGPQGTLTSPPFKISHKFVNFLVGGGGHAGQTCINLLIDDKVVRTATGKNDEKLEWFFWNVEDLTDKTACIQIVDKASGGWGHVNMDQIELADEPRSGPVGPIDKLPDYGSMALVANEGAGSAADVAELLEALGAQLPELNALETIVYPAAQSKSTAVASNSVRVRPGGSQTFTFALGWFFPNHEHGREYDNRFDSAAEVAGYMLDNHERLAGQTRLWHKTFYEDSTLPRWLLFRLHSTVCNLATGTCQWWKNGRFWAWEGVGCCEGTCTHVWNYAHAPARLFGELERSAREMQDFGEGFDADSGLVGFRSNRAYAADGQCGTVLKAYREHLCSADDGFLKRNWPKVKKALEFSIRQDGNDDGLIENSQHNTFDINFEGPNTFVGSLYLAALRAGEQMAGEMGDEAFAERCRKIYQSGRELTIERLWEGEYFVQAVDLAKHPRDQYGPGCLSDQLFGQGWAHQLALGYVYPKDNVVTALRSVWRYNWTQDIGPYNARHGPERWFARPSEPGLFTCTWPKSSFMAQGVRYRSEVWTGIEYQVAGHMAWEGMVTEALAICDGIEKRYHPGKHNPFNEVECGDHYARAMASWGVYTALAGFEYHGPKGHLGFAPRITPEDFRAAFTGAAGWGLFTQKREQNVQSDRIELRWGTLKLKSLSLALPTDWSSVRVLVKRSGREVGVTFDLQDGRCKIALDKELVLAEGDTIDVEIRS